MPSMHEANSTSVPVFEPEFKPGWWLRRIVVGMILVLALVLATRFGTVWIADRQMNQLLADLKAQGLPTRPEDLQPPAVRDADNAALVWQQAFNLVDQTVNSPRTSYLGAVESGWYPPYTWRWHQLVNANEKANGPAMALALKAAQLPSADWGTQFVSPLADIRFNYFRPTRDMARRLIDSAEADLIRGDARTGLQKVRATLRLASHCRADPLLIPQLVGNGIDALTSSAVRRHVRSISLQPTANGLSTDEFRELIHLLLEPSAERSMVRGLASEIVDQRETFEGVSKGWLTQAVWTRSRDRQLRDQHKIWQVSQMPPGPEHTAALDAIEQNIEDDAHRPSRHLESVYASEPDGLLRTYSSVRAQRRVLAIALAVRWYGLEHGGYPESLDILVPRYLPAIPENPFAPTPFEYQKIKAGRPDGGDRPVLYIDLGDGVRGTLPALPEYDLYFNLESYIRGRVSDLIGWNATQAEVDAADRK
jgi:hypothetical protein